MERSLQVTEVMALEGCNNKNSISQDFRIIMQNSLTIYLNFTFKNVKVCFST